MGGAWTAIQVSWVRALGKTNARGQSRNCLWWGPPGPSASQMVLGKKKPHLPAFQVYTESTDLMHPQRGKKRL